MDSFGVEIFGRMKTSDKPGATRAGRRNMDEIKLKPCPFCGGTKIFVGSVAEIELMDKYDENYDLYNSQFQVVCDSIAGGCGASSGCCKNKAAAIEAWNRRADNG